MSLEPKKVAFAPSLVDALRSVGVDPLSPNSHALGLALLWTVCGFFCSALAGYDLCGIAHASSGANKSSWAPWVRHGIASVSFTGVWIAGVFVLLRRTHNIRELAKRDQELRRTVFHSSGIGMLLVSPEHCILDVNQRTCEMLGYERRQLVGQSIEALYGSHAKFFEFAETAQVQESTGAIAQEWPLLRQDKLTLWCTVSISLVDVNEPERGYVWGLTDTSRLRDIQDSLRETNVELSQARDVALSAVRTKAEFLANMSHEIRTPLHGILGTVELLQGTCLSQEQLNFVNVISRTGDGLLTILNDILDYSKCEAGQLQLERVRFSPSRELRELSLLFVTRVDPSRVTLAVEIDDSIPVWVMGDSIRFRQILGNLLSNAAKFTSDGRIDARLFRVQSSDAHCRIALEVKDTGIGISAEQQSRLFLPFSQADTSTARRFGGSGLGLMLAKRLVEAMDGSISLQSELGKGSTFLVEVSFGEAQTIAPTDDATQAARLASSMLVAQGGTRPRVLIVEDVAVNQLIAQKLLEKSGANVTVAGSGMQAVEVLLSEHFDVVLMDCQMPEMDGYEATRRIRDLERGTQRRVPIIAMTAGAMAADRQRCIESGMDDYICKPVSGESLIRCVREWLLDAQSRVEVQPQQHSVHAPK